MKTSDFDFDLPMGLIAHEPVFPRDSSGLLVIDKEPKDFTFKDLPDFLNEGDVLVFNNSKVIPARLFGSVGEAEIEILLHKKNQDGTWSVFAKPAKKLKAGGIIKFADDFDAEVLGRTESGEVILKFNDNDFNKKLEKYGHIPLPPYIKRADKKEDRESYQTVYARYEGSVAAPTAGLHFTDELLKKINDKGVETAFVTLHVGAGTFQPVKVENINEHKMHSEFFTISKEEADVINKCRENGGRVVCVGTTSLRVLESAADAKGCLKESSGETDIFIKPGYKFKVADVLVTNFHLPKSTLFMLVCAFAGEEKMKAAYKYAIENKYRFFSYGDSSLLYKNNG